jgi:hypothetical protein
MPITQSPSYTREQTGHSVFRSLTKADVPLLAEKCNSAQDAWLREDSTLVDASYAFYSAFLDELEKCGEALDTTCEVDYAVAGGGTQYADFKNACASAEAVLLVTECTANATVAGTDFNTSTSTRNDLWCYPGQSYSLACDPDLYDQIVNIDWSASYPGGECTITDVVDFGPPFNISSVGPAPFYEICGETREVLISNNSALDSAYSAFVRLVGDQENACPGNVNATCAFDMKAANETVFDRMQEACADAGGVLVVSECNYTEFLGDMTYRSAATIRNNLDCFPNQEGSRMCKPVYFKDFIEFGTSSDARCTVNDAITGSSASAGRKGFSIHHGPILFLALVLWFVAQ